MRRLLSGPWCSQLVVLGTEALGLIPCTRRQWQKWPDGALVKESNLRAGARARGWGATSQISAWQLTFQPQAGLEPHALGLSTVFISRDYFVYLRGFRLNLLPSSCHSHLSFHYPNFWEKLRYFFVIFLNLNKSHVLGIYGMIPHDDHCIELICQLSLACNSDVVW